MAIPYHFDALLPTAKRYASPKFRRVAWKFSFKNLDWYDALELVAFVETIGLRHARYILHWRGLASIRAYQKLRFHIGTDADEYILLNQQAMGVDEGLAILRAMLDGGWKRGKLPRYVGDALRDLRKAGNSRVAIAKATGLTQDQVSYQITRGRKKGVSVASASAFGALAV